MNKQQREHQLEVIKKMPDGMLSDFILELKKTKKTYEDKLKAVECCLRDTKEKIRIAENVIEIREAGIGDQLPLFQEAL